ncbi:glycosyltransferase [bacterium]|nr:MAG: glycosyltransferase [bacterium]
MDFNSERGFEVSLSIDVVQLGARMHYAVPAYFTKHEVLNHFYTDLWRSHIPFYSLMCRLPGFKAVSSRFHPEIPLQKTKSFPFLGIQYARSLRKAYSREEETLAFLQFSELFQQRILASNTSSPADCVYAFNSVAKTLFSSKKYASSFKVLEQTLVPRATEFEILEQEYTSFGLNFPHGKYGKQYAQLELEECELADLIVTGSDFVKQTLIQKGISEHKIEVVPYGFTPSTAINKAKHISKKLRLLFVGNGGIRKGITYAIEAVRSLKNVELSVAGLMESEILGLPLAENVHFLGSVNRSEMEVLFQTHDVLLLPSLCEGSATVSYEAMAYGLPVICTPNSGTVITHQKEGWIIPVRDSKAIQNCISQLLEQPILVERASSEALKTSHLFTVEKYGKRLLDVITKRKQDLHEYS